MTPTGLGVRVKRTSPTPLVEPIIQDNELVIASPPADATVAITAFPGMHTVMAATIRDWAVGGAVEEEAEKVCQLAGFRPRWPEVTPNYVPT